MESKIYERQIIKQSLSHRVVDEQQIQRHFKSSEISELYTFNHDIDENRPLPNLPKDNLLADIFLGHKDLIVNYHEHDSLLENRPEEGLSEEERKAAWAEYETEKERGLLPPQPSYAQINPQVGNQMFNPTFNPLYSKLTHEQILQLQATFQRNLALAEHQRRINALLAQQQQQQHQAGQSLLKGDQSNQPLNSLIQRYHYKWQWQCPTTNKLATTSYKWCHSSPNLNRV